MENYWKILESIDGWIRSADFKATGVLTFCCAVFALGAQDGFELFLPFSTFDAVLLFFGLATFI